jgi:hypothetical protein
MGGGHLDHFSRLGRHHGRLAAGQRAVVFGPAPVLCSGHFCHDSPTLGGETECPTWLDLSSVGRSATGHQGQEGVKRMRIYLPLRRDMSR